MSSTVIRKMLAGEEARPMSFGRVSVSVLAPRSGPFMGFLVAEGLDADALAVALAAGWFAAGGTVESPPEPSEPEPVLVVSEEPADEPEPVVESSTVLSVLQGSTSDIQGAIDRGELDDLFTVEGLISAEENGQNKLGRPRVGVLEALFDHRDALVADF